MRGKVRRGEERRGGEGRREMEKREYEEDRRDETEEVIERVKREWCARVRGQKRLNSCRRS